MKADTQKAMKKIIRNPAVADHIKYLAADDRTIDRQRLYAAILTLLLVHGVEEASYEAAQVVERLRDAWGWERTGKDFVMTNLFEA